MEPGAFACRQLARLNPLARLAWAGRRKQAPDETNAGNFCLVQLYPLRTVGSLDSPNIISELWEVTTVPTPDGKGARTIRSGRGPIFSKDGKPDKRDWDPLFWIPVYVAKFADYGVPDTAIPHGGFRDIISAWAKPIRDRVRDSVLAKGKELNGRVRDLSEEATDFLWHEASKTGQTTYSTVTREEKIAVQKRIEEKRTDFTDYYDGTKVFR